MSHNERMLALQNAVDSVMGEETTYVLLVLREGSTADDLLVDIAAAGEQPELHAMLDIAPSFKARMTDEECDASPIAAFA